ncbi:MAG: class I SAM-dependent methyltransferase [Thiogranum sp.]
MSVQFLDRLVKLPSSPEQIHSRFEFDHWMMTDAERSSLTQILRELRPECALEIGTYRAGSLSVLARYSGHVYSLDVDPSCRDRYAEQFGNVEFVTGLSQRTLPLVLEKIRAEGRALSFVLIDGEHAEGAIRSDINALLAWQPVVPLYVIMHDSFNPGCRKGIRTADWASNPHVHLLELDYVCGRLMPEDEGPSYREMWCGFALAILLPESRTTDLRIHANESMLFRAAYWRSSHPFSILRAPVRWLRRMLGRLRRKLLKRQS